MEEKERCPECGIKTIPLNQQATHEELLCDTCYSEYEIHTKLYDMETLVIFGEEGDNND